MIRFIKKQLYISNILGSLQNQNQLNLNYLIYLIHLIISNIVVGYNYEK